MLAYAASRPAVVDRRCRPGTLLLIIGAHVSVVAVVMSAKMEFDRHRPEPPIVAETIKVPPPPAPDPQPTKTPHAATATTEPVRHVVLPPVDLPPLPPMQPPVDPGVIGGGGATVTPVLPKPAVPGITSAPTLLTPESARKPPYPASKLLNEEEAVLTLRLAIDQHGRVIAVEPVGRADTAFLEAARRHLMAHWRYKPAMDDGKAVPSSMVIRLRFELDG